MSNQPQPTSLPQSLTGDKSSCLRNEVGAMLDSIRLSDVDMLPFGIREYCLYMHDRLYDYAYNDRPMPISRDVSEVDKVMENWMFPLAAFYHSWRGDEERAFADARYMLDCYLAS